MKLAITITAEDIDGNCEQDYNRYIEQVSHDVCKARYETLRVIRDIVRANEESLNRLLYLCHTGKMAPLPESRENQCDTDGDCLMMAMPR